MVSDRAFFADSRVELLYQRPATKLTDIICEDIKSVSPETEVRKTLVDFRDAWDFEDVYDALHLFARAYKFDPEHEDYLVHITTGTHVAQICLFLLTEARYFPGQLVQTSPLRERDVKSPGEFRVIDLDLSRYDRIATRFQTEKEESLTFLKSGIATLNKDFNRLIENIERVAIHSKEPILLTGPTGAGKSRLARRVFELKKTRHQLAGNFVEVNCATIRGDAAMSALFGHVKGSFTGAVQDRKGLLVAADGGLLFLDEIGELGQDEQAMLLRAVEEKRFLPVGSDRPVTHTAGQLMISIASEILSSAVYPLAIDPEVSWEQGIDTSLRVSTEVHDPSLASNGGNFLPVWCAHFGASKTAIRGKRISKDGQIIDHGGLNISESRFSENYLPAVAADGMGYRVV